MSKDNIVYAKTKDELTGEWIEDQRFIARKFGAITKACFCCKKAFTCEAVNVEDCKFETRDDVVIADEELLK